jgi:hypothetical protein
MKLSTTSLILLSISLLLFQGCAAPDGPEISPSNTESLDLSHSANVKIGIIYHPFGVALSRNSVKPVPDYDGWPDERMRRDIERLEELGIDFVLIALPIAYLDKAFYQDRYKRFLSIIKATRPSFSITLLIQDGQMKRNRIEQKPLVDSLLKIGILDSSRFLKQGSRHLVVLDFPMKKPYLHPAFSFRYTQGEKRNWPAMQENAATVDTVSGMASVRLPAISDDYLRRKERRRDDRLENIIYRLRLGVSKTRNVLIIRSWNNFGEGVFIEPNSADWYEAYNTVRAELQRFSEKN